MRAILISMIVVLPVLLWVSDTSAIQANYLSSTLLRRRPRSFLNWLFGVGEENKNQTSHAKHNKSLGLSNSSSNLNLSDLSSTTHPALIDTTKGNIQEFNISTTMPTLEVTLAENTSALYQNSTNLTRFGKQYFPTRYRYPPPSSVFVNQVPFNYAGFPANPAVPVYNMYLNIEDSRKSKTTTQQSVVDPDNEEDESSTPVQELEDDDTVEDAANEEILAAHHNPINYQNPNRFSSVLLQNHPLLYSLGRTRLPPNGTALTCTHQSANCTSAAGQQSPNSDQHTINGGVIHTAVKILPNDMLTEPTGETTSSFFKSTSLISLGSTFTTPLALVSTTAGSSNSTPIFVDPANSSPTSNLTVSSTPSSPIFNSSSSGTTSTIPDLATNPTTAAPTVPISSTSTSDLTTSTSSSSTSATSSVSATPTSPTTEETFTSVTEIPEEATTESSVTSVQPKPPPPFNASLACQCGLRSSLPQGVGTTIEHIRITPWLVSISAKGKHLCAGTLINDRYVLTAASCVDRIQSKSDLTITSGLLSKVVTMHSAYKLVIHPKYDAESNSNNLALLGIRNRAEPSANSRPVCLPFTNMKYHTASLATWVHNKIEREARLRVLQSDVRLIDKGQCVQPSNNSGAVHVPLGNGSFCAEPPSQIVCLGDIGGSLHAYTGNHQHEQIGLVSSTVGCKSTSLPGIYSSVRPYLRWILFQTRDGLYCKDPKARQLGEWGSGFKARSLDGYQDFKKITQKCIKDKTMFEDDEFTAGEKALGKVDGGPFKWKRPHEICRGKKPRFIVDGADRFDVRQGELGNCWLLAAVADLTLNEDNFKMVVPDDNSFGNEYTGAFHFRFWQFGKWIDVVIDDRLPVGSDGQLAFMSSEAKTEFWSPLLEKAYAKLNGSYEVLDGGLTFEALEDFTGGFTEVIMLARLESMNLVNGPEEFFDLIKNTFMKKSFMGCSVKVNPDVVEDEMENGLIKGHAYSITNIRLVNVDIDGEKGQVRLFRIRNPWGTDQEWNGDWSDKSTLWNSVSDAERTELEITFDADGEFWMSYEDFLDNFERIEICHSSPHSEHELLEEGEDEDGQNKWKSHSVNGSWTKGVTAGGSLKYVETFGNNPQYLLDIGEPDEEENTLIICLLKKDRKAEAEIDVQNVALNIFRVDDESPVPLNAEFFEDDDNAPLHQLKPLSGLREITLRFSIPSGYYVIIPSSVKPNQEGDFLLRVFTECKSKLKLYDEDVNVHEDDVEVKDDSPEEKARLEQAHEFFKYVAGEHEEISWWDLKLILDKSFHDEFQFEGFGFSEDICRSMIAIMDADRSGQLGFFEFTNLWKQVISWKKVFNKYDKDVSHTLGALKTNELRQAFKDGGYNVNKDILEDIVLRYGDRNGEVALDKFIVAALKLKAMIELYKRHEVAGTNKASFTMTQWLDETLYS